MHVKRRQGRWIFRPALHKISPSLVHVVPVKEPWVEALCRLSESTLKPLLHFRSSNEWVNRGLDHEIRARLLSYEIQGPYSFFSTFGEATAWLVASAWDQWEKHQIQMSERLNHLADHVDLRAKEMDMMKMHPAAVAAQLRNGYLSPSVKGTSVTHPFEGSSLSPAIDLMNEHSLSQQMLSRGGATMYRKRSFRQPTAGRFGTEAEFETSGLWWWRRLDSVNQPKEFSQFTGIWERSAFFYEFRARLQSKNKFPLWEGFSRPWWDLDQTQRGILYYLWPPDLEGPNVPPERPRQVSDFLRFMIKVDFAKPLDEVVEDVRQIWERLEPELTHLWGIGQNRESNTSDKPESIPAQKLEGKWAMLEALDRERHFGVRLPAVANTTKNRQMKYYLEACQEAGIPS